MTRENDSRAKDSSADHTVSRRDYLRLSGAAAGGALGVSASGIASAREERGITFDRVIDAVDDLGLDPTGGRSVNADFSDSDLEPYGDSILIEFPEGTYRFTGEIPIGGDGRPARKNIGFLGIGDVKFRPDEGANYYLFNLDEVDAYVLDNIDVDQTASEKTTNAGFRLIANEEFYIGNVEFLGIGGNLSVSGEQIANGFNVSIREAISGKLGTMENVVIKHGAYDVSRYSADTGGGSGKWGMHNPEWCNGDIEMINCEFSEFPNNGVYTVGQEGRMFIEDCTFKNNTPASVRVEGEGSYVRNCEFVTDMSDHDRPLNDTESDYSFRGIWVDGNYTPRESGLEISDCTFRMSNALKAQGAIVTRGGVAPEISNCEFELGDVEVGNLPAIYAD
ncbi:right-handed parallel beta-helix repeat-containing protein [Halomarina rubra]|uniref:Right-handed parallel beta-helix repeat-containing protein n=1 Tax=Halomarina rubra TaxID=2071873 RepID=A0ABD6ATY0_9EURY|nr:right-handed parallel beta-helix repeat-containing protein [Halomarina rubra]